MVLTGVWLSASDVQELGAREVAEVLHRFEIDRASLFVLSNRAYFRLTERLYEGLPVAPKFAGDVLGDFVREASRVGVEVTATVVCMNNPELSAGRPDLRQVDPEGRPHDGAMCLNKGAVRRLLRAVVYDIASNYDVAEVELDYVRYKRSRRGRHLPLHLLACKYCYCDACRRRAEERGLDWGSVLRDVRAAFSEWATSPGALSRMEALYTNSFDLVRAFVKHPSLAAWLRFRAESIAEFVGEVKSALEEAGTGVELSADLFYPSISWMVGQDYELLGRHLDSAKPMVYTKRMGAWEASYLKEVAGELGSGYEPRVVAFLAEHLRLDLPTSVDELAREGFPHYVAYLEAKKARLLLPARVKLYVGLYSARVEGAAETTPEDVREASSYALAAGADGLYFFSLRATPKENLEAIREVKRIAEERERAQRG